MNFRGLRAEAGGPVDGGGHLSKGGRAFQNPVA